jgi:hypothetical protein
VTWFQGRTAVRTATRNEAPDRELDREKPGP